MTDLTKLPRYQCHKQVRAIKFIAVEICGPHYSWLILEDGSKIERPPEWMRKHMPVAPGYLVLYDGGYQSYSPAQAFESGYTLAGAHTDAERLEWLRRNWESQEFGETCDMASPESIDAFRSVIDGLIDHGQLT